MPTAVERLQLRTHSPHLCQRHDQHCSQHEQRGDAVGPPVQRQHPAPVLALRPRATKPQAQRVLRKQAAAASICCRRRFCQQGLAEAVAPLAGRIAAALAVGGTVQRHAGRYVQRLPRQAAAPWTHAVQWPASLDGICIVPVAAAAAGGCNARRIIGKGQGGGGLPRQGGGQVGRQQRQRRLARRVQLRRCCKAQHQRALDGGAVQLAGNAAVAAAAAAGAAAAGATSAAAVATAERQHQHVSHTGRLGQHQRHIRPRLCQPLRRTVEQAGLQRLAASNGLP